MAATDGANNTVTNAYQVAVKGGPSATLTYDANGNMTSDGTNSYSWDAENRMIKITYPGSGNNSQFVYDAYSRMVSIVEYVGGSISTNKQFVYSDSNKRESRDGSGAVLSRFFALGEEIGGSNYLYSKDHLGSVKEVTDVSGVLRSEYVFDPFGRISNVLSTVFSDFQYAGYYAHEASGLWFTATRAYNASTGRFLNRDPLGEEAGESLLDYSGNDPIDTSDPSGLDYVAITPASVVLANHVGLIAEVDTAKGPVYWSIDGFYTGFFSGSLDMSIVRQIGEPFRILPDQTTGEVVTNDPAVVAKIIANAKLLQNYIKARPIPYSAKPGKFPFSPGSTSNQVTGTLLRSVGLPIPPDLNAPGINLPLGPGVGYPPAIDPGRIEPPPPDHHCFPQRIPKMHNQDYKWPAGPNEQLTYAQPSRVKTDLNPETLVQTAMTSSSFSTISAVDIANEVCMQLVRK